MASGGTTLTMDAKTVPGTGRSGTPFASMLRTCHPPASLPFRGLYGAPLNFYPAFTLDLQQFNQAHDTVHATEI
jgi:hypothetical protein